jgi:hypothetical protein
MRVRGPQLRGRGLRRSRTRGLPRLGRRRCTVTAGLAGARRRWGWGRRLTGGDERRRGRGDGRRGGALGQRRSDSGGRKPGERREARLARCCRGGGATMRGAVGASGRGARRCRRRCGALGQRWSEAGRAARGGGRRRAVGAATCRARRRRGDAWRGRGERARLTAVSGDVVGTALSRCPDSGFKPRVGTAHGSHVAAACCRAGPAWLATTDKRGPLISDFRIKKYPKEISSKQIAGDLEKFWKNSWW